MQLNPIDKTAQPLRSRAANVNESRYVLAELADAGSYMISMGSRVEGPLDLSRLQDAFRDVVARHEAMRTGFVVASRRVLAQTHDAPAFTFHHTAMEDAGFEAFRDWAVPLVFDGVRPEEPATLVRLLVAEAPGYWRFTVAMHHAISDGFSRGVVNRELLKRYCGEDLPEVAGFGDFQAGEITVDAAALAEKVAQFPAPLSFLADGDAPGAGESRGVFIEREAPDLGRPLRMAVKTQGATKFGFLGAAYALGLKALSGQAGIASFFQSEGRKALGAPNSVVGPFSITLPLDLSLDPDMPFGQFAQVVSARVQDSVAHEQTPLTEHILEAGKAPVVSLNMFPPAPRIRAGDLEVGPREFLDRRTEYDLNLVWSEDSGVLRARAFYDSQTFSEPRVAAFLDLQLRLLAAAIESPEASCAALLRRVQAQSPAQAPATAVSPAPAGRLHDAFFETVAHTPETPALLAGETVWRYGELARRALGYTAALKAAGAAREAPVAVIAARQPEFIAALLGISAYGASFAVLDASYPAARLAAQIEVLGARHLFLAGDLPEGLALDGVAVLSPLTEVEETPPDSGLAPRAVAYHLFTSGTTGVPKRVDHPEATLMRFTSWQAALLGGGAFRTMLVAGLAHDPVMRDIFLPLSTGGAIVLPGADDMQDPTALAQLVAGTRPDVLHLTPATGHLIALGIERGDTAAQGFDSLRAVFWGGDALKADRIARWRQLAPGARQFNLYGSTETPQAALIHEISPENDASPRIPIGLPVPWTGARIEQDGQTVGLGDLGEIVIELADPVCGTLGPGRAAVAGPSQVHYSGDMGIMLPQKGVVFLGRADDQVQLNAHRVELSEITHQAERLPDVAQAVAVVRGEAVQTLALYVVAAGPALNPATLRAALARALPSYMVPQHICTVDHIPLTPNGKADLAALPDPAEQGAPDSKTGQGALSSGPERRIAAVLAEFSGQPVQDRETSLADLGVDSLSRIEARLGLEELGLSLPRDWEWLSVAALAALLPTEAPRQQASASWFATSKIETFLVLRCLAIVSVVAHHTQVYALGGASMMLIVLAGFSFGHLQLPAILSDGRTGRIWATLAHLTLILIPVSLAVFFMHKAVGNNPDLSTILPYKNLARAIDVYLLGKEPGIYRAPWLWFLHAYLQMFFILAVVLSIGRIRAAFAANPWRATLIFFLIAEIIAVGLVSWVAAIHGLTPTLLKISPTTLMPILILGILMALARTRLQLGVSLAMVLGHVALQNAGPLADEPIYWVLALGVAVFVPYVRLPKVLTAGVLMIAAESLAIYLSNKPLIFVFAAGLGISDTGIPMMLLVLVAGVLLGKAARPALNFVGVPRLARMRIST